MRTVRQREVNPVSAQAFRAMTPPPFLRALAGRGQGSGREVNSTRKTGQRRSPPLDEAETTTEALFWCHPFGPFFPIRKSLQICSQPELKAQQPSQRVLVTGRKDDGSNGVGPRGGKGGRVYADSGRTGREGGEAQGHPDRSPERLSLLRGWGPQVYVAGRGEDHRKGARAPAQASAVSRGVQRFEVGLRPVQEPHDDGLFLPVRLRR